MSNAAIIRRIALLEHQLDCTPVRAPLRVKVAITNELRELKAALARG